MSNLRFKLLMKDALLKVVANFNEDGPKLEKKIHNASIDNGEKIQCINSHMFGFFLLLRIIHLPQRR